VKAARDGFTAVLCDTEIAAALLEAARMNGLSVPGTLSLMAYGRQSLLAANPCGQYVTDECVAEAVAELVAAGLPHKPLTLWLTGKHHDGGTTAAPPVQA
jgi:hypothetical protein